jgi:hypothetical protein
MSYMSEAEIERLRKSQTVADMLEILNQSFDLNVIPTITEKSFLVSGLVTAMDYIKPIRKIQNRTRQRIRK